MANNNNNSGDEGSTDLQQGTLVAPKRSTGPRTPTGKDRTKHNATKHGLFSRGILLKDESQSEFDELLGGLRRDFEPEGTYEEGLVYNVASNFWRRQRLLRAERASVEGMDYLAVKSVIPVGGYMDMVVRYETHLYRALERDLNELERAQERRERKKAIAIPHDSTPSADDPQS